MTKGVGQIHVRLVRGHMRVIAMGQTPRGQRYIKQEVAMKAKTPADPEFKTELATAVEEILS